MNELDKLDIIDDDQDMNEDTDQNDNQDTETENEDTDQNEDQDTDDKNEDNQDQDENDDEDNQDDDDQALNKFNKLQKKFAEFLLGQNENTNEDEKEDTNEDQDNDTDTNNEDNQDQDDKGNQVYSKDDVARMVEEALQEREAKEIKNKQLSNIDDEYKDFVEFKMNDKDFDFDKFIKKNSFMVKSKTNVKKKVVKEKVQPATVGNVKKSKLDTMFGE